VRQLYARRRKGVCALNNNYYLRYEKTENAKYVSHLDFVRMFGRAMRRAHLPIAFSEGFNPHPLLGFALPLSVGYTSECEILEIVLTQELAPTEIMESLNAVLPKGVKILSAHEGKSNMKKLDIALYQVFPEKTPAGIAEFLSMDEILIEKKTKSGIKECDIRGDIKDIKVTLGKIEMTLSAGSRANLKPEVVVAAMNKYIDGYHSGDCRYHRKQIYDADMNVI
jgi:radical SAM-linked protein